MKTPSLSENLCEFNRCQASFVSQDKYEIYKRGGSLWKGRGSAVARGFVIFVFVFVFAMTNVKMVGVYKEGVGAGQWPGDLEFLYLYLCLYLNLRRQIYMTDTGVYKKGVEVYKECIRVGAGQWPEGATTRRRVAATHDALLFAQRRGLLFCNLYKTFYCTVYKTVFNTWCIPICTEYRAL